MKTMFYKKIGRAAASVLALLSLLSLLCTACDKDVRQFKGAYSSKTSGSLVLQKAVPDALDTLHLPATLTVALSPESGQMRIAEIKDNDDFNLMVSVNLLAGDALSFRAKAKDGDITLETTPHERYIQAHLDADNQMTVGVTTGGSGRIYEDVIVFNLDYQGFGMYMGVPYQIIESRVDCIATANE